MATMRGSSSTAITASGSAEISDGTARPSGTVGSADVAVGPVDVGPVDVGPVDDGVVGVGAVDDGVVDDGVVVVDSTVVSLHAVTAMMRARANAATVRRGSLIVAESRGRGDIAVADRAGIAPVTTRPAELARRASWVSSTNGEPNRVSE